MPRPPSPGRSLLRLLDAASTPLYALDGQRRIVFANRALGEWVGIEPERLAGIRCDYHAAGDGPLTAAAAGLCPPPEAFAGELDRGSVSRVQSADRAFERRPAQFVRLPGNGSANLLLVVVLPAATDDTSRWNGQLSPERLHGMLQELRSRLGKRFHVSQLLGESDAIRRVREQVRVAAEARTRVLIVGPQGSGREHVARTIHYSQKSTSIGPLVPIACALVDAESMQATLAALLRKQRDAPTERPPAALLLDVDRLRPDAQQELAGFLLLPNIELFTIATARCSLQRLAAKGKFRRDLAYALSTLTIPVPALKSRPADVPLLAQHFLEETNAGSARQLSGFHPAAIDLLASLSWRGNIDELAQAVREACARASGPLVRAEDLPDWVHLAQHADARPARDDEAIELDGFLAEIERELLERALRKARGNKSKAAQLLGLSRARLLRRLGQLGLAPPTAAEEPVVFEPLPDER